MPDGCDVSEIQGDLDPEFFTDWDFVIIRAFNENGRLDHRFAQNWSNSRGRTERGVYGWPIPGDDNRALGAQLVAVAPDAELGYWADYEHSEARGWMSVEELEDYLNGIGDRRKGFYCGIGVLPRSPFFDALPWWVSDYGPNDGVYRDPGERPPFPPADRPWQIHQWTSNPIDKNYAPTLHFGGTVTTGQDLITAACSFLGEPYNTGPGRTDPDSGYKDCSGLVAAAYQVATGNSLNAFVSTTIFAQAVTNDLVISRDEAYRTPGACLFKPDNPLVGWGPAGHIAFSDGEGGTVEATPRSVQRLSLAYNAPWSPEACLLPGIDYGKNPPVTAPQEDDVVIIYGQTVFGVVTGAVYDGKVLGATFDQPCTNDYGLPDDALAWNLEPGRGLRCILLDPKRLGDALYREG